MGILWSVVNMFRLRPGASRTTFSSDKCLEHGALDGDNNSLSLFLSLPSNNHDPRPCEAALDSPLNATRDNAAARSRFDISPAGPPRNAR